MLASGRSSVLDRPRFSVGKHGKHLTCPQGTPFAKTAIRPPSWDRTGALLRAEVKGQQLTRRARRTARSDILATGLRRHFEPT